jgi:methylase of polypeptide subunit release factors
MSILVFNERSWAIDLISEINTHSRSLANRIRRASGESGLKSESTTLFPDVILHGEDGILQGWELKLPDTDLHDEKMLKNAEEKANLLGTNSFLVWNGREAALWAKSEDSGSFVEHKTWLRNELSNRKMVEANRSIWIEMLLEILQDLEFFLETGVIKKQSNTEFLDEKFASKIVQSLFESDSIKLAESSLQDETLRAQIHEWSLENEIEFSNRFKELAKLNILAWVNRFVFCHYLSRFNPIALKVQQINPDETIAGVKKIFQEISSVMDFGNVFVSGIGDEVISDSGWRGRLEFNSLLTATGVYEFPESSLRDILEEFAFAAKRKSQGQFATPKKLALALANLALDDLTGQAGDPCCGSGTIAKSLYETKVNEGMDRTKALESVWASDKYQMPLQLTSINLSDPQAIKSLVQVFQSNVFDLDTDMPITLTDPQQEGLEVTKPFPKLHAIASNLPYVRQEKLENQIPDRVFRELEATGISKASRVYGKADLYASIIFDLERNLADDGRVAVVVSNSWLGTKWGASFQDQIRKQYFVRAVIKSGKGRWFSNADVVTTLLVFEKRGRADLETPINFVTTHRTLDEWDRNYMTSLKVAALQGVESKEISVNAIGNAQLDNRRKRGFYWRVNFFNSAFLEDLLAHSVPVSTNFEIARGARTGQDDFYYPDTETQRGIEREYLVPLLKNSKECKTLLVSPQNFAFSCSKSMDELRKLGHTGALSWIQKFENRVNGTGEKLSAVLGKQHSPWYFLSPNETGEFALSMNPYQVLAVYRSENPIFMNQRLIRLTAKQGDKELMHALLNSAFGMAAQEFLGFGRGEGVLDLRNDSVKEDMRMLDPIKITPDHARKIKDAFKPLLDREALTVFKEFEKTDRLAFEDAILSAYGLQRHRDELLDLVKNAVTERLEASERLKP